MARRPTARQLDKAFDLLDAAFLECLQEFGLRENPNSRSSHPWVLETPAGELLVSIHDGAVFTRFDDLERAKRFCASVGKECNRYSGKWNFHYSTESLESLEPRHCVPELKYWFTKLMEWDGTVDPRIRVPA